MGVYVPLKGQKLIGSNPKFKDIGVADEVKVVISEVELELILRMRIENETKMMS
jgi:hypothetical protein